MIKEYTVVLISNGPMLMHSDKLANPAREEAIAHQKLLADKKTAKTTAGKMAVNKSQYINALYLNRDLRVVLPMMNIRKSLIEGARRFKRGKDVERGVIFLNDSLLNYDGPSAPAKLWANRKFVDARTVKIGRSKVVAYRPIFPEWSAEVQVIVDDSVINWADVMTAWVTAGNLIGIGDYRPLFGRYTVEEIDQ